MGGTLGNFRVFANVFQKASAIGVMPGFAELRNRREHPPRSLRGEFLDHVVSLAQYLIECVGQREIVRPLLRVIEKYFALPVAYQRLIQSLPAS